ncbi:MAG: hypothetical protein K1X66_02050 [Verrucomicrobiae bacterium]|nr:hypothetical protein [Verrucomicrobiae bacterium]
MISALLLLLGTLVVGGYDYRYRATLLKRERNRWLGCWVAVLFILVAGWEWFYAYRVHEGAAWARGCLALLGAGAVFFAKDARLGKRGAIFYGELVASWIGFSAALTELGGNPLVLFLGWEWGWFWLVRLIGFHRKISENRFFRKVMHALGFLTTLCLGLGLYGIVTGWHQKVALFCFISGWGFRLGIVPFYLWGFRAVSISPIGIFFTTVAFVAQVVLGGVVLSDYMIPAQFDADSEHLWQGFQQGLLFLSWVNLIWATILLFWQRSLRQWLFFLYLFECGWFLFSLSQRQWGSAVFSCFLSAVINLGLWGVMLKVGQQKEGSDAVIHFVGLMDRSKILGMGFCLLLGIFISLMMAQSFIFLFGTRGQQGVAVIAFFGLAAIFQMLKKIVDQSST